MGSWADLGIDILELIAERISDHTDLLHFGVVCKQWHTILINNLQRLPHKLPLEICLPRQNPLPMLMQLNNENAKGVLDFISIPDHKIYSGFTVPGIESKWICGSFNGWVVTVEIDGQQMHLLNPLTKAQIPLPSISTFQPPKGSFESDFNDFAFVQKVIVFSQSSEKISSKFYEDCVLVSIISCHRVLSICRPRDNKWTNIEGSPAHLFDIIPYKGKIYGVNWNGTVVAFDVANEVKPTIIARTPRYWVPCVKQYLVESTAGELLQVVRVFDDENPITCNFRVYKLVALDKPRIEAEGRIYCYQTIVGEFFYQNKFSYEWVEMESLGDQILFLGYNCSKSLSASLYPSCKGNCIYFTDDVDDAYVVVTRDIRDGNEMDDDLPKHDMGMYDMESKKFFPYGEKYNTRYPVPPVWVMPNPW